MLSEPVAPQRVLILTPTVNGQDGISAVAREMLNAFSQSDRFRPQRLHVWSLGESDVKQQSSHPDDVNYSFAHGSKARFVGSAFVKSICRSFDLVIVNHLRLLPVALLARAHRGEVAAFLHGVECWRPIGRLRSGCLRRIDRVIANSRYTWDGLVKHNRHLGDLACAICPLGVPPRSESGEEMSRPRDWPKRYALIVGRMCSEERYKGHDQLIDLWPRLLKDAPDASLLIAGDGDDRPRLQSKVNKAGLQSHIRFLGRVADTTLDLLYQHAGLFAMPSSGEGFGLVFLEAMRSGVACIGGVGAASEIIRHEKTGLLVHPDRADEVLLALTTLFQCPERSWQMGQAGLSLYKRGFTDRHFQDRLRQALGLFSAANVGDR